MRSLGSIRARVERLASAWPMPSETAFISWVSPTSGAPPAAAISRPPRRRRRWPRPSRGAIRATSRRPSCFMRSTS